MHFFENGFELVDNFISQHWLKMIVSEIEKSTNLSINSGVRHINKKLTTIADYLNSTEFQNKSQIFLPAGASLVRAILFNKSAAANWYVSWHQDKTVSVSKQFDAAGWRTWSVKDGSLHVQPPLAVLEGMVTIRIHLDATPKENACLKVIPDSHKLGLLSPEQINGIVAANEALYCEANQGAALVMRPHLLHASNKSIIPGNRRVLHFEFSNWPLPEGIFWE
ncbi:phytanoyl-CoA dioxygenase family protein [Undibacterium sp. Di24W]|uniref:phytanoyl-CoA dioxygenase family protein n=1 Tax=Undibacterium sp. Di24W TaxID=3413033 RepID=UPI003BF1F415